MASRRLPDWSDAGVQLWPSATRSVLARPAPSHLNDALAFVLLTPNLPPPSPAPGPLIRPALELDEIPYADAGVGHTVWGSAVVLALFLRCPAGLALLSGASPAEAGEGGGDPKPRVLEIGAGLGLPGRDLAARGAPSTHTHRSSASLSPLAPWPWPHALGLGLGTFACFRHDPGPLTLTLALTRRGESRHTHRLAHKARRAASQGRARDGTHTGRCGLGRMPRPGSLDELELGGGGCRGGCGQV